MHVDDTPAVRALVSALVRVCSGLPGAEQYVMVHHPAFRLGKKPFAIAGMEQASRGATVSVNLGREAQPQLLDDARFTRTPYIGQHGWVTVAAADLKPGELDALVVESFRRVASTKQLAALDAALARVETPAKKDGPRRSAAAAKRAPAKKAPRKAAAPRKSAPKRAKPRS